MDQVDYWNDNPPPDERLAAYVAAYLGVKPKEAEAEKPPVDSMDPSGIGDLIQRFPHGMVPQNR